MSVSSVYINNISSCFPNPPVFNDQVEEVLGMVGDSPSRAKRIILRSNGIKSRHYAIDPQTKNMTHTNAQLTAEAISGLEMEGFHLKDIKCLATGTTTPDQTAPNHGVMVHGELETPPCEVIATSGICLSGMTALKYAYMSVLSGCHENAVASGSEVASVTLRAQTYEVEHQKINAELEQSPELAFGKDFLRWMLSDGAGAMVLQNEPNKERGLSLKIEWINILSYANEMETCMYAGSDKLEDGQIKGLFSYSGEEVSKNSILAIKQDVKLLNKNIVNYAITRTLPVMAEKYNLCPDDVDHFLFHFSSEYFRKPMIAAMDEVGFHIPQERWFTNLSEKGNTGSASIYIMLDELFHSGKLESGQKILCGVPESGRFSISYMLLTVR